MYSPNSPLRTFSPQRTTVPLYGNSATLAVMMLLLVRLGTGSTSTLAQESVRPSSAEAIDSILEPSSPKLQADITTGDQAPSLELSGSSVLANQASRNQASRNQASRNQASRNQASRNKGTAQPLAIVDDLPPPIANPPQLNQPNFSSSPPTDVAVQAEKNERVESRPATPPPAPRPILPEDPAEITEIRELIDPDIRNNAPGESDEPAFEVLEQGPVHEAFAVPMNSDVQTADQAVIAPRAPPPVVSETPPAYGQSESQAITASGNDVRWIEGYWFWDSDRSDFLWISGFYRDVPPDRVWIRGEWVEQPNGTFAWYGGFWSDVPAQELQYLPEPPPTIRIDPTAESPDDDSFWMPGEWIYRNDQYVWREGYWTEQYDDWIWQPACYAQTSRGYVHVTGYWDYEPPIRGTLYAPVYFTPSYRTSRITYTPRQTFCPSQTVLVQLFVRPGRHHFYLGDYYGPQFITRGYRPWYSLSRTHYHSPSVLSYYQWKYSRSGLSFADSLLRYPTYFSNPRNPRPSSLHAPSLDAVVRNKINGAPPPRLNQRNLSSTVTAAVPGLSGKGPRSSPSRDLFSTKSLFSDSKPSASRQKLESAANIRSRSQDPQIPSGRTSRNSVSLEELLRGAASGSTTPLSRNNGNPFSRSPRESLSSRSGSSAASSRSRDGNSARQPSSRIPQSEATVVGPSSRSRGDHRSFPSAQPGSISSRSIYLENRIPIGSNDRSDLSSRSSSYRSGSTRGYDSSANTASRNSQGDRNTRNSISSRSMFPPGQQRVFVVPPSYRGGKNYGGSNSQKGPNSPGSYNRSRSSLPNSLPSGMRTNSRAGVPTSRDNVVNSRSGVVSSRGVPMSSRSLQRSSSSRSSGQSKKSQLKSPPPRTRQGSTSTNNSRSSSRAGGQPRSMSRATDASRSMSTRGGRGR